MGAVLSYIIAFVEIDGSEGDYPVNCIRNDIRPGDEVIIRLPERGLRRARVVRTDYLNWNCKGRIECLLSETVLNANGVRVPPMDAPRVIGLTTMDAATAHLQINGWIPVKWTKTYRKCLVNSNATRTAMIMFRKNGVDLMVSPTRAESLPRPYTTFGHQFLGGLSVRHHLSMTKFNLYEGIARFAHSFMADEGNYDRFFKAVGSLANDPMQVARRVKSSGIEEREESLRSVFAGCEDHSGAIYLGDGVYI